MGTDLIRKTETFLKEKLKENPYFFEQHDQFEYRLNHSRRVARIGAVIAEKEGMDKEAMIIACLLHDIAYAHPSIIGNGWINHGRCSASIARPFLTDLNLAPEIIRNILYGIAIHVDDKADFEGERTPFALTVGDADNIDRYGAIRLLDQLNEARFSEADRHEKLEILGGLLRKAEERRADILSTAAAAALWEECLNLRLLFLTSLISQIENSAGLSPR